MIHKLYRFLAGRFRMRRAKSELTRILRTVAPVPESRFSRLKWADSLKEPTSFYIDCVVFFHKLLPAVLREHRTYFHTNSRGFGEDAFHSMWYFLCREFKPSSFLEIGVYRGQILSLISLLSREMNFPCEVTGISPFLSAGDSVSIYLKGIDYLNDTKINFEAFALPDPVLKRAFSTDDDALSLISSQSWDAIYIDGNHDYEVAKRDWDHCAPNVKVGGIIVLDDSGLSSGYRPPAFATAGHPGPSKLASEIDPTAFREILQVGHNRVFQRMA